MSATINIYAMREAKPIISGRFFQKSASDPHSHTFASLGILISNTPIHVDLSIFSDSPETLREIAAKALELADQL